MTSNNVDYHKWEMQTWGSLAQALLSGQRKGQHYISKLALVRPGLVIQLQYLNRDCFYDDSLLNKAIEYVKEHWKD